MLLYLHIPFCDSKCFYCAFCSYTDKDALKPQYLDAALKQLEYELEFFEAEKGSINSVFVGGGTPSAISAKLYRPFITALSPYLAPNAEITTEANPNSASYEWLCGMRELGFNRVSFGVQTFDDKKLKFLGRAHSQKEAIQSVLDAKKAGFENISIDLIYSTKMDTKKLLLSDIQTAASLPINHLSAYSLTIEKGSKFHKTPKARKDSLVLSRFMIDTLLAYGFKQYEISNFSRSYECYHNNHYWMGDDYIGIGCGAVGFKKNARFYPSKDPKAYITDPLQKSTENLSARDLELEKLFLSMRSKIGLDLSQVSPDIAEKAAFLAREKKGFIKEGRFYNADFFLADEIALFLHS